MYGIRQCNMIFLSGEIGAFFTEIFFQISVVILNSNLHYQIFKFVIDNSDITSLNCLQHIQKRRNFDAKVTCHQPICLLLHAKWSRSAYFVMQTPTPRIFVKEVSKKLLANVKVWCSKRNNTKLTAPGEEETTCQFQHGLTTL